MDGYFRKMALRAHLWENQRGEESLMFMWIRFATASLLMVLLLVSCRASTPKNASETITLMTKYNKEGRHDYAIRLAQNWLKEHPEDASHTAVIYQQMAFTY